MKNRKTIFIIVMLLLALLASIWIKKEKELPLPTFTLQGDTNIGAGDIELKIWDNNVEDGDTVAVYFKGKKVLDTLPLMYEKKTLKLGKLKKGEYVLGVSAISEGLNAPASCSMSLSNGNEEKEFIMDAWVDSAASWKIIIE